jgi:hypothetical protein
MLCMLALQVRIVLKLLHTEHIGYELQGVRALFDARYSFSLLHFLLHVYGKHSHASNV